MSYISPATRYGAISLPPSLSAHRSEECRDMRDRISLRNGWKETLNALSLRRVPTYIFSGGYGDVIMQVRPPVCLSVRPLSFYLLCLLLLAAVSSEWPRRRSFAAQYQVPAPPPFPPQTLSTRPFERPPTHSIYH